MLVGIVVVGLVGCNSGNSKPDEGEKSAEQEASESEKKEMKGEATEGAKAGESAPSPVKAIQKDREARANRPPTKEVSWGYGEESGPEKWGSMAPAFAMCDLGKNQSPVDFADVMEVEGLPEPEVDYGEAPKEFVNKGYAIQVNYPSGNTMSVGDETYGLLQMHFHTPSEHTVGGEQHAAEAHFVHANEDGDLAVLGVFVKEGEKNEQLAALMQDVPGSKGESVSLEGSEFSSVDFLPETRSAFRYNGSLTTPPCSEGVRFNILTEPVSASAGQIEALRGAVGTDNARPVQPMNARSVVK
jgi:carbonic anhydrase